MARLLLSKRHLGATLLAAQCMETDNAMPLAVRERIQGKLQKLIPPKDFKAVFSLVALGIWAAPLLMKALPDQNPYATTFILLTLADIDFAPAVPVIARCAKDTRPSSHSFGDLSGTHWRSSIGGLAAFVLGQKISSSGVAKEAFRETLKQIPPPEVESLLKTLKTFGHEEAFQITQEFLRLRRQSAPEASV